MLLDGVPLPNPTLCSRPSPELAVEERDAILRSVISSQALSGLVVSYDEASRLLNRVLQGPLPEIG